MAQPPSGPKQSAASIFSRGSWPIIGTFLLWGTGSGAQTLARPLFTYQLTDSVFLVTVLISVLALSRMVSGPLTGFLADHWGRKPMAVTGAFLRGAASAAVFFVNSYGVFFALEFVGAIGVAMWQTTSQIIVADMSLPENRGRAVATRNTALRMGQILGPLLGGVIASIWGLHAVFFVNAGSKFIVMYVTWRAVKETRPEGVGSGTGRHPRPDAEPNVSIWSIVATRAFVALAITTIAIAMMNQGVFMTLFPIAAQQLGGINEALIGTLIAISNAVTLIVSFPTGMLVDRYGRKRLLVPGLLTAGGSAALLALIAGFPTALLAALVFGMGQSMTQGANQTYAMDLAPEDKRGKFLGLWSSFQSFGAFVGPLAAGAMVEIWSFGVSFNVVAVFMATAAIAMAVLGPETKRRFTQQMVN